MILRLIATGLIMPFVLLGLSAVLVLSTSLPPDPWRDPSLATDGEHLRMSDGAEVFIRSWVPAGSARSVIVGLHGLGQHSGYHARLGEALAANGRAYYAPDLRGNGLTRTPHGDLPSAERLYEDLAEVTAWLHARYGRRPLVLGHSLGAATAAAWAAERDPAVIGLVLIAPAMTADAAPVPWVNYLKAPAAWLLFRHHAVLHIDSSAYHPDRLARTIDLPAEIDRAARDPLQLRAMSMEFALATARFRDEAIELAPRIRIPTLTIVGDRDPALDGAQLFRARLRATHAFHVVEGGSHQLLLSTKLTEVAELLDQWLAALDP